MLKLTLKINGMMCGMCETHINDAIRKKFAVKKVTSSHSKNVTEIITEEDISDEEIKAVIDETGYELVSISREPYEKKGLFSRHKK